MESDAAELSVLVTDDAEIAELNETYRNKTGPTDVLSFSLREGEGSEFSGDSLGDLVISFETAVRQATEFAVSVPEELLRLLIHGTLHLHGYDHENVPESEAEAMRKKEQELFDQLQALL